MATRTVEAAVRRGSGTPEQRSATASIGAQVAWHVRTSLKAPALAFPKWTLAEAMAEVTPQQMPPPPPAQAPSAENDEEGGDDDATPEQRAEARAALAAEEEARGRRQAAAAILLQRRLPVLLARRRAILAGRLKLEAWAPWMARLNAALGLAAGADARAYFKTRAAALEAKRAAAEAERSAAMAASAGGPGGAGGAGGERSRSVSPSKRTPPSSATKKPAAATPPGSKPSSARKTTTLAPEPPPPTATSRFAPPLGIEAVEADSPPMLALRHLARAAQMGCRGRGSWHEVLNAARHLWNTSRLLLNMDEGMSVPTPALEWEKAPMPPLATPPVCMSP